VWWSDTNISEDCAAFIFRVEVHEKQKVDTYRKGRVGGGGKGSKQGHSRKGAERRERTRRDRRSTKNEEGSKEGGGREKA
jgi:hypothetical protein